VIANIPASGPAPTSALTTPGPGGVLGKDEFLQLLVTQLRYQDPLSPMKGEEMAVQLAQFTSVEQLINLNAAMIDQQAMQAAMVDALNGNSALAAIGKNVVALGDQVVIPEEGDPIDVSFVVGGAGGVATLRIYNEGGVEVGSRELGVLPNGRHTAALGDAADDLPPGTYRYEIDVRDENGNPVSTQTFVTARIDGVRYGSSGPVLTAGPLEIPIGAIAEIVAGS
jgi:flagellar basal-body rod modification protein FlgD